jgi:three-Cys-motif partner protein
MADQRFFDEATEKSLVKSTIVKQYFWAWAKVMLPVVSKKPEGRLAYVDLFAGPGIYADGTKSTPIMVLETVVGNAQMSHRLVTIFNDGYSGNAESLHNAILSMPNIDLLNYPPRVGSFEVGHEIAELLAEMKLVPTFLFVDPWGYKGVSLNLIGSVLKNWGSDCVVFFNYNRINMALNNESVELHVNDLFGRSRADELRRLVVGLSPSQREATVVEQFALALGDIGAEYVLPFCFKDERGARTSHHLILATKHQLGYRIMKEIMAKHSTESSQGVPSFEYCPATTMNPLLFELNRPLEDLEQMLLEKFSGQTLTFKQIYDLHNVGRPFIWSNYRAVLLDMEHRCVIKTDPASRRKGTFAEGVRVTFPPKAI